MNYKDTINLPRTSFPMKAELTRREPELQKRWQELDIYAKLLAARRGALRYVLHDGPPYANGDVHIGTGINKILKDIVVKYKTMRGFETPYVPGWDCHGLPIEHRVATRGTGVPPVKSHGQDAHATQLGENAHAPDKLEIRERCKKYAEQFIEIQRRQFQRLGVFGDWQNPYLTMDHSYEAAVINLFADLVEKGYVYRRLKPVHWCMSCRTALAEAELEYADEKGPSIYVKFPLRSKVDGIFGVPIDKPVSVLIWTTTPWTLPANVATALHRELDYALVRYDDPTTRATEYTILSAPTAQRVFAALGITRYEIVATVKGKALETVEYTHPFINRVCPLVLADYVRLEDGTGCVHTAPGHGEEDYATGLEYKLPILSPVDQTGRFTHKAEVFVGVNVFDADPAICKLLDTRKVLLKQEEITHSYPHCWRCKKPVIFRATEQWFISVDHAGAREKALGEVAKTKWFPEWGEARIRSMLKERPDWCISRQRAWGVPIPALYCSACNSPLLDVKTLRHIASLFGKEGAAAWFVRPAPDLVLPGTKCAKCGAAEFRKETDIFDVWFESGASHRAIVMQHPALGFPADLYLEGTDQHRGWFQLSLLPCVMSQGVAPFRAVLTHGFVVDEEGDKLSKSQSGGLLLAEDLANKYGADLLRLWISSVDFTNDIPVSHKIIEERAEPYLKIRNTFRYFLGNLHDFDPRKHSVPLIQMQEIDRWAISRLQCVIRRVTSHYEKFEFHRAFHDIYNFCVVEMSAFYLDIAKDRLYCSGADWQERRAVQTVLYRLLHTLTRLVAPVLVHTAEEIWQNWPGKSKGVAAAVAGDPERSTDNPLAPFSKGESTANVPLTKGGFRACPEPFDKLRAGFVEGGVSSSSDFDPAGLPSVHLAEWPTVDCEMVDTDLETRWDRLVKIRTDVLRELERLRKEKKIGSSLEAEVTVHAEEESLFEFLKKYEPQLPMIFIVSVVKLGSGPLPGSTPGVEMPKLNILASPSPHRKCERCWNRRVSVGENAAHPNLCARCVQAV